mmetsp:Transcript_883/g.2364  ORF Transcript_883/g.2364 Transcript_883/m.2364 type:complete len:228 (-) Transcript_883:364-1047(-)|eukprot:365255-Chlamydomonas_euryale.AAC.25
MEHLYRGGHRQLIKVSLYMLVPCCVCHTHARLDLKLENMVMLNDSDDSPVKIADFGLSKFFSPETVLSTMCGSPQYVAPEVLGVGDGLKAYSPAVDMWSVGVILFILLSGYSPFDDDNDAVLFEKIKKGNYDADDPIWEEISDEAKDCVAQLLTVNSEERLTAEQALQHPWLQSSAATTGSGGDSKLEGAVAGLKSLVDKRKSFIGEPVPSNVNQEADDEEDLTGFL